MEVKGSQLCGGRGWGGGVEWGRGRRGHPSVGIICSLPMPTFASKLDLGKLKRGSFSSQKVPPGISLKLILQ